MTRRCRIMVAAVAIRTGPRGIPSLFGSPLAPELRPCSMHPLRQRSRRERGPSDELRTTTIGVLSTNGIQVCSAPNVPRTPVLRPGTSTSKSAPFDPARLGHRDGSAQEIRSDPPRFQWFLPRARHSSYRASPRRTIPKILLNFGSPHRRRSRELLRLEGASPPSRRGPYRS